MLSNLPFQLRNKEKVILHVKPNKNFIIYYFFTQLYSILRVDLLLFVFWGAFKVALESSRNDPATKPSDIMIMSTISSIFLVLVIALLLVALSFIFWAKLKYEKEEYWITNLRVIVKNGILGYRIKSVPYSKISDVTISRSFIENILGVSSIRIQTLAGQISANVAGAEMVLYALEDPEQVASKIAKFTSSVSNNNKG